MRATGIIRRIDDLGRIVIPKEVRNILSIREGDALEIFIDPNEKTVCFKHYLPYAEPWRLLEEAADAMRENEDFHEFAVDVYALARKIRKSAQG